VRDTVVVESRVLTEGAQPAISSDGRSVVFTRNNSIWIIDVRTGALRLVGRYGNANNPTWSPSREEIAFGGNPGTPDRYGIWIVRRDGSHLRQLPGGGAGDGYPLWSPDGKWIAWTRGEQLWISDSAGMSVRALTSQRAKRFEFALAWSGDAKHLLYAASDGGPDYQLRLIEPDGSGQRADPTGVVSGFPQGITWTADGASLYESLWALTPGVAVREHRASGRSRTVLILKGPPNVGKLAVAADESFMVFDNPEPETDEFISIARLRASSEGH
jgi:dipeptidyl aminopeptidase/acylaminoacyl peptidase